MNYFIADFFFHSRITMKNKEIEALVGHIQFYSATYRLWKIAGLDPDCEDYGQVIIMSISYYNFCCCRYFLISFVF